MVKLGAITADIDVAVRYSMNRYSQALDEGRVDDVAALFLPDATVDIPGTPQLQGTEAIRAYYASLNPPVPMKHVLINSYIDESDGQTATAYSDLLVLANGGGWAVQLVGRYVDVLELSDGDWLFRSRKLSFLGM